jgi:hypothetical protein
MNKRLNIYYWLRKLFVSNIFQRFFIKEGLMRKFVFYTIYKSNHWNRYTQVNKNNLLVSGPGSIPGTLTTQNVIKNLKIFIKQNNINSILDVPCGDFSWMKDLIISENLNYVGWDIVDEIIDYNKKKYSSKNVNFFCKDIIIENNFENYDLIFSRDFFIHMKINDIKKILNNVRKSNAKFFACSNNSDVLINRDILVGQHRKINLSIEPFNIKKVYSSFYEGNEDCYINIYKISDL